jgi:hypothetical protein
MRHTRTKPLRFAALTLALTAAQMLSGADASEAAGVPGASDATAQMPLELSAGSVPASLSATSASSGEHTGGDVSTLTQLVQQRRVTPLRSTVAGNYSAALSFFGDGLTNYVALSEQNTYWRVIATPNKKRAEAVYADFVAQTERLAAAQDSRAELAAQQVATQRLIEQAQIKAQQLQADAQIAQTQRDEVATQQAQAADQVKNLTAEDQDARKKLSQIRHQVVGLQIASNLGLPPEHPARLHKIRKHAQHTKSATLATAQ